VRELTAAPEGFGREIAGDFHNPATGEQVILVGPKHDYTEVMSRLASGTAPCGHAWMRYVGSRMYTQRTCTGRHTFYLHAGAWIQAEKPRDTGTAPIPFSR